MPPESLLRILLGIALLLLGRRLFWLFVGVAGFLFGMEFAPRLFGHDPGRLGLILALAAGLVGAVVAILAQKIAVGFAGFLMGAYVAKELLRNLGAGEVWGWGAYLVGGILGAILVLVILDWALIFLSSFAGAMLLVEAFDPARSLATVLLVILFMVGLVVQTGLFRREARHDT